MSESSENLHAQIGAVRALTVMTAAALRAVGSLILRLQIAGAADPMAKAAVNDSMNESENIA